MIDGPLPDELLVIGRWDSEASTVLTLQDFVIAGRSVIPVWIDRNAFRAQIAGSGFEDQGVAIKRTLLHAMLDGSETILLNPGAGPVALTRSDLAG